MDEERSERSDTGADKGADVRADAVWGKGAVEGTGRDIATGTGGNGGGREAGEEGGGGGEGISEGGRPVWSEEVCVCEFCVWGKRERGGEKIGTDEIPT